MKLTLLNDAIGPGIVSFKARFDGPPTFAVGDTLRIGASGGYLLTLEVLACATGVVELKGLVPVQLMKGAVLQ